MLALADRHRQVVRENEILRREVDDRDRRIDALEAQALELNQRRRDVGKRIDDLLAQIDQLDAGLGAARD